MPTHFGWVAVIGGLIVAMSGARWLLGGATWIGRLPGDVHIETQTTRFYFPITTCIVLSLVGSLLMWLVNFFRS